MLMQENQIMFTSSNKRFEENSTLYTFLAVHFGTNCVTVCAVVVILFAEYVPV